MKAIDPAEDKLQRWLPTKDAVDQALAMLAAEPRAEMALIPMVQPGKTRGVWIGGQQVETVATRIRVAMSSTADANVPGYSTARNTACEVGRQALRGRQGTVGYAVVERGGHVAVFEDF